MRTWIIPKILMSKEKVMANSSHGSKEGMGSALAMEALTFDDVLLLPGYSEVLPSQVDLSTRLTKRLSLHIPLLSAAMDTVTESKTAITLAQEGGIGVVHKNLTIGEQA